MSISANRAKTKWNAAHYKQLKFNISPTIAAEFKRTCEKAGVSMASEISRFMAEYGAVAAERKAKPAEDELATRRKRRKLVAKITLQMERVLDAETESHENVPENLRGSSAYEDDEDRLRIMGEAIALLELIY
jgi:hypothetical protein